MSDMTPERLRRKTRPMRAPEEVALSFTGECEPAGLGLCANHKSPLGAAKTCLHVLHLTELIRTRDAEVGADERTKVLAGFIEERATFLEHDTGTSHLRQSTVGFPYRRLVGPWEPTK